MTTHKVLVPAEVTQIYPENKRVSLEGLYLDQKLAWMAAQSGKSLVVTDFLTDRNGVIAKVDRNGQLKVPLELRNPWDWRLFQELLAQAEVVISGASYLKRVTALGSQTEDVLCQFEPGNPFEKLGDWRLQSGYAQRSPDLAILAHSLDFEIPHALLESGRKMTILTANAFADSSQARSLRASGVRVIGSGPAGVDGNRLIDILGNEMGYRVIMMATGPAVLKLLLDSDRLDILYITEVQQVIPWDDPANVRTVLSEGKQINQLEQFTIAQKYVQEDLVAEDGSFITQYFLRYDKKDLTGHQ